MWSSLSKYNDTALLFLRVTLGTLILCFQGWPVLKGGARVWTQHGAAMKHIGITFAPLFWGLLEAATQSLGCVFIVLGLFFRPSCLLLFVIFAFGAIIDFRLNGTARAAHALELAAIFLALLCIGPGKFSVDKG